MEIAIEELNATLEKADEYLTRPEQEPEYVRLHIKSLDEDIALVVSIETTDVDLRRQALEGRIRARRVQRRLEHKLIELDKARRPSPTATPQSHSIVVETKQSSIKLPKIKIPVFDGDITQFIPYWNILVENVVNDNDMLPTAKWIHLRDSLTGPPKDLISEMPQSPAMLSVALKLLNDTYGGVDRPIAELYRRFHSLPQSKVDTTSIRITHSKLEGILSSLESLQHSVDGNHYIRSVYIGKFPQAIVHEVLKSKDMKLQDIREQLSQLLSIRESIQYQTVTTLENKAETQATAVTAPRKARTATNVPSTPPRCLFCQEEHWSDTCKKYDTVEKRKEKASDRCFKCLRFRHPDTECQRQQRRCCYCDSFQHNRAFCDVKFATKKPEEKVLLMPEIDRPSWTARKGCFLTCMTKVSSEASPQPQDARVLIDTAGGRSMITRDAAERLRLRPTSTTFHYTGIEGEAVQSAAATDRPIRFHSAGGETVEAGAYITDQIATDVAVPDIETFQKKHPKYDSLYFPPTGKNLPIDILIGGDNLIDFVFFDRGQIIDQNNQLMATKFGWMLVTRSVAEQNETEPIMLTTDDDHIKTMFDLEIVGLSDLQKTEIEQEQKAIDIFHSKLEYIDQRYYVGWPWISDTPQLNSNYGLALGRLKSLHRKLQHQPQLLRDYDDIIRQQEDTGIVETGFPRATSNVTHYIPHHPIICPEKNTSTRLVYDASAKTDPKSKSLNENIHKGRKWLTDMNKTLLRFRRYQNAAVSDISKAFHQIGIREEDRDAVRFLWLKDPKKQPTPENIQIYRFRRVAFGIVASPFLLEATISYHLQRQEPTPYIAIIQADLYADNLVTSFDVDISAEELYKQTKKVFNTMSMNMTKWAFNEEKFMQFVPEDDRNDEIRQNVLGLRWHRRNDTLAIKPAKEQRPTLQPTKRNVLRKTAAIFDPLGWAVPILLMAKLFLRKLWEKKFTWDENMQQQLLEEWYDISTFLDETQHISLPRQLFPGGTTSSQQQIEYHTFVDASTLAFAVVTYVIQKTESSVKAAFVAARSRIAPTRVTSVPKLELMALQTGVKFTNFIRQSMELKGENKIYIWSDSLCVLSWTRSEKILPAVIERQMQQIKKHEVTEFRYVPSELNRADVATRGAHYRQLQNMEWWTTPEWLINPLTWPQNRTAADTEREKQLLITESGRAQVQQKKTPLPEENGVASIQIAKYSSLHKLLQVTANCIRIVQKMKPKNDLGCSDKDPYQWAKILWIKWDQQRIELQKQPKLGRLPTVIDSDGLVRIKSRIANARLPCGTTSPIVLVPGSTLTRLIIMHLHQYNMHTGTAFVLAALRKNYYLPRARREIFHTIRHFCTKCKRFNAAEYQAPEAADLPEFRVNRVDTPFQTVGIDVCGPFNVRLDETRKQPKMKRWVMIFTCAVIRAVHLEVIEDMTTKEILLAFRRFTARRGVPSRILCDNAPQFGALDHKFQDIWATFAKSDQATQYFAPREIKWQFIPQNSPWMGGMYERLIHSIKQSLDRTYGVLSLHHRQFEASILEIEGILNSRPLTYIEDDTNTELLTPAHFLRTKYPMMPIETQIVDSDDLMTRLWKASQHYLSEFWQHWTEFYLTALRDRHDQLRTRKNVAIEPPKPGDLVLLADPNRKRTQWRMAVIERLVHSADGRTRSAQIRLPNGTRTVRPIIKLAPLGQSMQLPGVTDDQLNPARDAIVISGPEGAATQQDQPTDEAEEVVELGLDDLEAEEGIPGGAGGSV